ncbi:MAG: hypothetical protein ACSHYA_02940 [Opitutaceae bacterium]
MLLSIVTVIKSPAIGFEKTYASVLREFGDCDEVEYLIKEWDGSVKWAESIHSDENADGLSIRKAKGSDSGVFDGMNQSILAVNGRWVLFLNAGDWFAKGFASHLIPALKAQSDCDFVYCDGVTVDAKDGREFLRKALENLQLNDFLHRAAILHPCLVVNKSFLARRQFDLEFDLAADYDMMIELVATKAKGYYLPVLAAFILSGGLSEQARVSGKRQALRSLIQNAPNLRFKLASYGAFARFICRHVLIVYVLRNLQPLLRLAQSRSGGKPSGTYT